MKAKIRNINLPDAPPPTKARRVIDPWEKRLYEDAVRCPNIDRFQPKTTANWTDARIEKMKTMWLDGFVATDIAPHVGGNIKATTNKLHYMVSRGVIPKRVNLTDEIRKGVKKDHESGMEIADICRKYIVTQKTVRNIIK